MKTLAQRIQEVRLRRKLTQKELAGRIGRHSPQMISRIERGHSNVSADSLLAVAKALDVSVDYLYGLTDNPLPVAELEARLASLTADPIIADPQASYGHQDTDEPQGIPVIEIAAAAGGGATVFDETPVGRLWFRQDWLRRQGIRAEHCAIINVRGKSMEPALPDGCSVLVDRSRCGLRASRIYVMRTEEGLVVKRAQRNKQGWWLMSDNPQWPPMALTEETDIIGEVRWMARTL